VWLLKAFFCWLLDVLEFFITLLGMLIAVAAALNFFVWLSAKSM